MTDKVEAKPDVLGLWIRLWDLAISAALLIGAFLLVRLDAIPQLRALAADKAWFSTNPLLLDMNRRGYSFETVRDHMRALGGQGRDYYAHTFVPIHDLALSLFLLTFLILLVLYATQCETRHGLGLPAGARKLLIIPPIVQFLADISENLTLRQLAVSFPSLDASIVAWASLFTQIKWGAVLINALIVVALGGHMIYRWLARPARSA